MNSFTKIILLSIGICLISIQTWSQKPQRLTSSEIQLELKKLNTLGTVLYVAAHPDDENTRLIGYLSKGALMETAYLSVTRGDGGQNLVGPEIRERLGLIRTHELLKARSVDGSKQFFTRANDFGYSKTTEETLRIWDKDEVLSDVVWVIRKYRPDIIITRFPPDERAGHGHHTSSAILAHEAFKIAGDKTKFPEQLEWVQPWQPKSIYWNTHPWFYRDGSFDKTGMVEVPVGDYNAFIGKSYTEIAAESRSMHKSQGFGSTGTRGEQSEFLQYIDGDSISGDLFSGINTNWNRIEGGENVGDLISKANLKFRSEDPSAIVPVLMDAYDAMSKLPENSLINQKRKDLAKVITSALGLFSEITTNDYSVSPGDSLTLKVEIINRSDIPVKLLSFNEVVSENISLGGFLENNQSFTSEFKIRVPKDMPISQPYWLKEPGTLGMFHVENREQIGKPENSAVYPYLISMEINGVPFEYEVSAVYKRNDPVDGEVYRPFVITPPVFVNITQNIHVFANGVGKPLDLTVKAGTKEVTGNLKIEVPKGWKAEPAEIPFHLEKKYQEQMYSVMVYPPKKQDEGQIKLTAEVNGTTYSQGLVTIEYDHIPTQMIYPEAVAKVVKIELEKKGSRVGYIMGAGDDIPASLEQIGYHVDLLTNGDITIQNLKSYDAIIVGIRAYNTVDRLKFDQPTLMQYVEEGGTMIVQYNTSHRLVTPEFSPYPIELSRARVSDETVPVTILAPDHPVVNSPNKITEADFNNWVQERGLYFPGSWDERYIPILSSNDPGEDPRNGGLLVASHGKGFYIYTGYSWFRELPAGVPGAYRLFTNLISIGK